MFGNLTSLTQLIFSTSCIGCANNIGPVCSPCEQKWRQPPTWSNLGLLPLVIGRKYNEEVQHFVLAAKEMGSIHARNILAGNIARSTKILLNQFNTTLKSGDPLKSGVILIPIPSRKSAVRRRGVDHAKTLASDVIEQIDHGLRSSKFESMEILQHTRTIRDQSGLNPIERQHNLQGSLSVDFKEILEINGRPVIVIDDVVTSGASIREAIRALHLVGIRPLGAVTACASPIHFPIR